jgi:hypothetical protein
MTKNRSDRGAFRTSDRKDGRKDESVYDRIRREAREKQEREKERSERGDELMHRLGQGGVVRL